MKKLLFLLAALFIFRTPLAAQQVINGDSSYVPGAWIATQVPNAGVTGTTLGSIAKLTGTGTAVISATTDTSGMLGIVVSGAGTTGNASIAQTGQVLCNFDGATTANHYVINSTTIAGDCEDGGSTPPSVQTFGRVLTTNGAAGIYAIVITTNVSGNGGVAAPLTSMQYNNNGVQSGATGITTPDGNSLDIAGPIPWVDATKYGVRSLPSFNTITTTTNGTATVTTTGVSDFIKNDGIVIPKAGAATTQSTPAAPAVTVVGATGAKTINYKCVGVDRNWGLTAASTAGTVSNSSTVFGTAATLISSISRSANVVTVTTATNMPFSSGTFHAVIVNVTGGSTGFSGLQAVTVTSATTLTYSQTGANESGTLTSGSYVMFKNAFIVTQVQATAGSNQIVLTTDINHNIPFISSGSRPSRIYLDGIKFAGATNVSYADGTYAVSAVSANTITVTTPYTSPITVTGTANAAQATSQVAQMTVTSYPVVDVACPAIAGTTQFYAVYADYGSGYAPVGFTPWGANIFEDYGAAWTQTGLVIPPGMSLPATPPIAAQNKAYTGQITAVNGSTLTVTPSVPSSVTSVTSLHDNGAGFNNALAASCATGFGSVYLPLPVPTFGYYLFSAPLDLGASGCNRARIVDGGALFLDGTIYSNNNIGYLEWKNPSDVSGWNNISTGATSGGQIYIFGHAPTMMADPQIMGLKMSGMKFELSSNGQIGLLVQGTNTEISDTTFETVGGNNLSSIPLYYYNAQFGTQLHNISWSGDANIMYPLPQTQPNSQLGDVSYWPVPVIEVTGEFIPKFKMDGINYGNYRAIQFDGLYPNLHTLGYVEISDVDTFQAPQQGLVNIYGGNVFIDGLKLTRDVMDSVQGPLVSCIVVGPVCSNGRFVNEWSYLYMISGPPWASAFEIPINGGPPAQNTNDILLAASGFQASQFNVVPSIFASTPACSTVGEGTTAEVNDSSTSLIGATITGGGANKVYARCDGTNWTVLGASGVSGSTTWASLAAGTNTGAGTFAMTGSTWDLHGDLHTLPVVAGTVAAIPATCTVSELYFATDATAGQNLYECTPTNVWTQQLNSGAAGASTSLGNLAAVAINTTLLPAAVNTVALGSTSLPFTNVCLGTVANQTACYDTSSLSANRTIKIANAAMVIPQGIAAISHDFLTALSGTTGAFTQAQPTLADIAAGASPAGLFDFTASTMELPESAGFTANVDSTIGLDTTANTIHFWINSADAIGAAFASAPAGSKCLQSSGTKGLATEVAGVCGTTTPSSIDTFTNKTENVESTGNSFSEPIRAYFPAAGCGGSGSTAGNGWDVGTTNIPVAACSGTTVRKAVLQFARGNVAYLNWHLPPDWNASVATDIELGFTTTDTTNGHVTSFNIQTACNVVNGTATDDPTLNALQALSVTTGASQISGGELVGTKTGLTMTGCAADRNFEVVVTRNNSGTDTNTDTGVALKFAEITTGVTRNAANR